MGRRHRCIYTSDVEDLTNAFRGGVMRYVQHRPGRASTEIHDLHTPLLNLRRAHFGQAMTTMSDDGVPRVGFVLGLRGELIGCGQPTTSDNIVHYDICNGVQLRVPAGAVFVSGSFDKEFASRLSERHGYPLPSGTHGAATSLAARERLSTAILALTREQSTAGITDQQIEDTFCRAFLRALDQPTPRRPAKIERRRKIVRQTLDYIEAHYAHDLTITELCAEAGTTERTLRYAFAELVGLSPQRYIMQRRLDLARSQLKSARPGITVESVATSCGFHHLGRFSSYFRESYGESPRQLLVDAR